jgi:RHS repeat-associated protein
MPRLKLTTTAEHPALGQKAFMARTIWISLFGLCGVLFFASFANAQTTCASNVTTQWFYAGNCYASQGAAVAAMNSAFPQNSVLTVMSAVHVGVDGSNTVTYVYMAPSPLSLISPVELYANPCCQGLVHPDEQSAVNSELLTGWTATLSATNGAWTANGNNNVEFPVSVEFDPNQIAYERFWDLHTSTQTILNDIHIYKWLSASCPAYYIESPTGCTNTSYAEISSITLDCPKPSTLVGDPCDAASGEFTQTENDYSGAGLSLTRSYHSATLESVHGLGTGWTHNYSAHLSLLHLLSGPAPAGLNRPDGHHAVLISEKNGNYVTLTGDGIHVVPPNTSANPTANFWAVMPDGSKEVYDSTGTLIQLVSPGGAITTVNYTNGLLSSVVGPFGHSLQFAYNASNEISTVTDPAGTTITYSYDGVNNLSSVKYQDGKSRIYQYTNAAFPNNLTGILDESGTQFLSVGYDSNGRASSSQNAGGANAVSMVFNTTSATVTDGLGGSTVFGFTTPANYAPRVTSVAHNGLTTGYYVPTPSVDPQQRATQVTDANGNVTQFAYDTDHLTSKTEALGAPETRTTSYQYLSVGSALPTLITEALKTTSIQYYPGTNTVETKTITDTTVSPNVSRIWTYTYNSYGQVLTVDGPRTDVADVITYTYSTCTTGTQCGQIATFSNALGQVTTYNTYNAHGQPLTITDPNGVVTTLTYDTRLRLKSRQAGTETTGYSYYPTGLLQTVTLPDSSSITYGYDGAHRLTDITDGLGNHTHYVLDSMGNRTTENTYDPSSVLHRTHKRAINTLNQIYQDVNAAGTAAVSTTYTYDNNGNLTSNDAPLARNTVNQYDELNRLKQITDPANGVTQFAYDANDKLISVIDPRTLATGYTNNGFGDVAQLVSPDSGTTINTYDSAGNPKTTKDARSAVATYAYDALNRVTQIGYTDQTINFTYDAGTNGKGRLTGASDTNHSLSWAYDTLGRITGKGQTVGSVTKSVGYGYTNGDLTTLVTPSGQTVAYGYTNHRISSIAVNATTYLSNVTYEPLGPVNGWTWGDGSTTVRTFTTDGLLSQISPGEVIHFGYDNALRTTAASDTYGAGYAWSLGYDLLDRITSASKTGTTDGWTYDGNGNRLTQTGTLAVTLTPAATSNQLSSTSGGVVRTYGYDNAGNTTSFTGETFTFNQRGRMSSATSSGGVTDYIYNALGQLIEKYGNGGTTLLMYDEAGHLLGEYASNGALIQETVWMDDTPVATLRPNGTSISVYYVQADQLNAPRSVSRTSDHRPVWRWDPDPFGTAAPNQNPYGFGTFIYNLRFPGQYYMSESGLFYNYFRDYDPQTGRYIESDPIGLTGGLNTYSYVSANPMSRIDSLGLYGYGDIMNMWNHYCDGTGTDRSASFDSINWGDTQAKINNKVKSLVGTSCSERSVSVNFNVQTQTGGADAYIIGRHVVKATGTIKVHCDCTWSFDGNMSSALGYDPYDFDASNRGFVGESLTWIGAHRCPSSGKPFNVYLPGSETVTSSGTIPGGTSTCCNH